jgi:predicted nucleic acid-binding protein
MTLTDAGPLIALLNRQDRHNAICKEALASLPVGPLVITWPCFTEAMHLLYQGGGYAGQESLWGMYQADRIVLHNLGSEQIDRMITLMEKYQDTPMDLADASLIATAEQLGLKRIFTLDSDFRVYRLADGSALEVAP